MPERACCEIEETIKWAQLKRNKTKYSEELQLEEKKWKDGLEDLFDIALAHALGKTTI